MNTLTITHKNRDHNFSYPSSWEECTRRQLRTICSWLGLKQPTAEHITSRLIVTKRRIRTKLTSGEIYGLAQSMKWASSSPHFAASRIPRLFFFRGPKDCVSNLTFEQLGLADQEFNLWAKAVKEGNDKAALRHQARLAGVLYRPWPFRFNKKLCDIWATILRLFGKNRLLAITYNFWGMRSWLNSHYPETFSASGEGGRGFGWRGLIVGVAGPSLGTPNQVANTNCHTVLIHLEQNAIEIKRAEQRRNQARR